MSAPRGNAARAGPEARSDSASSTPKNGRKKLTLTRRMLKAMGIEDEKIDQIIDEHAESVNALLSLIHI